MVPVQFSDCPDLCLSNFLPLNRKVPVQFSAWMVPVQFSACMSNPQQEGACPIPSTIPSNPLPTPWKGGELGTNTLESLNVRTVKKKAGGGDPCRSPPPAYLSELLLRTGFRRPSHASPAVGRARQQARGAGFRPPGLNPRTSPSTRSPLKACHPSKTSVPCRDEQSLAASGPTCLPAGCPSQSGSGTSAWEPARTTSSSTPQGDAQSPCRAADRHRSS
jgi:hypothetical protein